MNELSLATVLQAFPPGVYRVATIAPDGRLLCVVVATLDEALHFAGNARTFAHEHGFLCRTWIDDPSLAAGPREPIDVLRATTH